MKIVVLVRTLNESKNIDRFCQSYEWADEILIADGGSEDDTVSKARKYHNTFIYHYPEKLKGVQGTINPRGKHINFLIDWGHRRNADWLIFDDCDCVPSIKLRENLRDVMEQEKGDMIFAKRMFILGDSQWFPDMTKDAGLLAWKSSVPISADESSYTISMDVPSVGWSWLKFEYPYALLHYFYPDEETLQMKKSQYIQTGEVLPDYDPKTQFGRIEKLPDWATWR